MSKLCSKCGEAKALSEFWKCTSNSDGRQKRCKACQRLEQAERAKTDRWKETAAAWRAANPEKHSGAYRTPERNREYALKWRINNPDKWKEVQRKTRAMQAVTVSDMYVKRLIARGEFSLSLIPDDLIAAKRAELKLKRLLKEKQQ